MTDSQVQALFIKCTDFDLWLSISYIIAGVHGGISKQSKLAKLTQYSCTVIPNVFSLFKIAYFIRWIWIHPNPMMWKIFMCIISCEFHVCVPLLWLYYDSMISKLRSNDLILLLFFLWDFHITIITIKIVEISTKPTAPPTATMTTPEMLSYN